MGLSSKYSSINLFECLPDRLIMDLNRWKIFQGLDPSLISKCKIAKFVDFSRWFPLAGFLVLQNDEVHAIGEPSNAATGREVSKVESLCGKGIIDFYGHVLGFAALSKSGCVYSWSHQPGMDDSIPRQILFPEDVESPKVCQVSSGFNHNLCLTSNGQVFGWGGNCNGQLGSGGGGGSGLEHERDAIKINGVGHDMVQVAAGACSSFSLDAHGRVWVWGSIRHSTEAFHEYSTHYSSGGTPKVLEDLYNIRKIAVGSSHLLALSETGELYFWGDFGPMTTTSLTPTKITIENTEPVTDIGSRFRESYAVFQTKDTVYLWGIWYGRRISEPMATQFASIEEAFASAESPTMLRPIAVNVRPHGVEDAWKCAVDDPSTSDIVFSVDNEKLHAHATFLKLRSEYFRKMFDSDWGESQRGARPIEIQGFSFRVFKAFMYFLYHESLMDSDAMTVEDLAEVMRAADFYGNDDLRSACENKLKSLLTLENSCFIYACAVQSNAQNLQHDAAEFMAPVFSEVVRSPEFANMDNDCMVKLMIHFADLNVFQVRKKRRLQ